MSEQESHPGSDPFGQWMALWKSSTEQWQRAVASAAAQGAPGATPWLNPAENWKQWTQQWMEAMGQAQPGGGFGGGATGVGPDVLGRMGLGSELFLRLGEQWLSSVMEASKGGPDAWRQALTPAALEKMQEAWQEQIRRLADGVALFPLGPAASTYLSGFVDIGQLGQAVAGRLGGPWGDSARELYLAWQQAQRGDPEALRRFAKTWKETYDQSFGRLLQAPMLGYSREPTERLMRSVDAFVDYLAAVQEFTAVLERVGRQAGQRWFNRVSEMATDGKIPSHRTVYGLYLKIFEESFADVFKSPEYSRLQAQMVDAGMRFKRRWSSALEDVISLFPIPSDSEMKELYQAFHELRKTVKQQQRRIAALEQQLAKAGQ